MHVFVCPQVGLSLEGEGSAPVGGAALLRKGLHSEGSAFWEGVCLPGALPSGVCLPGADPSPPDTVNRREVCILLECTLVVRVVNEVDCR